MSAFRVVIRIIPVTNNQPSFEPVPFSALTDGNPKNVNVLNITESTSGINYRIERVEDVQSVGPGETLDSVNRAYTEKLKGMGFIQVQSNLVVPNSYDKNFKFCLPEVVSLTNGSTSSNANSLTLSLVKNAHHSKNLTQSRILKRNVKYSFAKNKLKAKTLMQMKKKRLMNSQVLKLKGLLQKMGGSNSAKASNLSNSSYIDSVSLDKPVDNDLGAQSTSASIRNDSDLRTEIQPESGVNGNVSGVDLLDNSQHAEFALSVTEPIDFISNIQQNENSLVDAAASQSDSSNQMGFFQTTEDDFKEVSTVYVVSEDNPFYHLLEPFKTYFLKGECLICGFVAPDVNYNAAEHMREHISADGTFSYYKCACCDDKFFSPKNLYDHVIREDKTYTCDICCLRFKRKYQFLRHNTSVHKAGLAED